MSGPGARAPCVPYRRTATDRTDEDRIHRDSGAREMADAIHGRRRRFVSRAEGMLVLAERIELRDVTKKIFKIRFLHSV